jgi:hypothetical protein
MELTDDLQCMNCHKIFDRSTQKKLFTKTFIEKTYKKRREELLLQREMALMPATQPAVALEKGKRLINQEIIIMRKLHYEKMNELAHISKRINDLSFMVYNNGIIDSSEIAEMKSAASFVLRCSHEDCRGFVSRAYRCGACNEYTCPDCHEPKQSRYDAEHVCEDNKKANVAAINRECKPCVSCGTYIYRSEGCPQMFCTQCHILFDWNTGRRIEHSRGHNPHYLQWLRENGRVARDIGDVMCGGLPEINVIIQAMKIHPHSEDATRIACVVRCLLHIHHYERPRYPLNWNDDTDSEILRVKWSLGDITTEIFKTIRQRMEKKILLRREIGLVLEMAVNSATDVFQRFIQEGDNSKNGVNKTKLQLNIELENIRLIVNENMHNIANDFSNKTPRILDSWDYVSKF